MQATNQRSELFLLWFLAAALAIFYTAFNKGRMTIDFVVDSNHHTNAQVYWDTGAGFSEQNKIMVPIKPGVNHLSGISSEGMRDVLSIRIDPLISPGEFRINDVKVRYIDCLIPSDYCDKFLPPSLAVTSNVVFQENESIYTAVNHDPWFAWRLPPRTKPTKLYLVNGLILIVWATALWGLGITMRNIRGSAKTATLPLGVAAYFLLFPLFYFGLWLSSAFINRVPLVAPLLIVCLFVFSIVYVANFIYGLSSQFLYRSFALILVAGYLTPEMVFHSGLLKSWPFGYREPPEYHWQATRSFVDNYQHSSLKYQTEIESISDILPKGSVFLSDTATSYYLTAQTDLFMRNPLRHHRIGNLYIEPKDIIKLCEKKLSKDELDITRNMLMEKRVDYVVINKDAVNKNVALSCMSRSYENVEYNLSAFSDKLFNSEHFVIYQVSDPL